MIDCQLHTGGVVAPEILQAFANVPRERFVPEEKRNIAYIDEDLRFEDGAFLMEPVVLARMLQAAAPRHGDIVLNIGDMTGYTAAVLSDLVTTIVSLEQSPGQLDAARAQWLDMDFCNIATIDNDMCEGCPQHAPYNLIIINGAVCEIPDCLLEQLEPGGRLVTIVRALDAPVGCITLVEKSVTGQCSRTALFDASIPFLPAFKPTTSFKF